GAPLPLPIRVSAGFLVKGLSGKMRIHNLPPRLMKRVIATRDASIWRSVIQAFSRAFRPYSPKDKLEPRQALPLRRPRCCFLYLTFLGINIGYSRFFPLFQILTGLKTGHYKILGDGGYGLVFLLLAPRDVLALIDPALHANHSVSGVGFGGTEIDVRAKRLQRQAALQVPLFAGDFRAVQPAGYANFDALAAEAKSGVNRLAHGAAERNALF